MTIVNELQRINNNIKASYTALSEKGAELPTKQNSDNLASTIANLEMGGGSGNDETLKSIVEATITDIVLPDNIEKIAEGFFRNGTTGYPFRNKNITSITANGVKEVGSYILSGHMDSLTEINLPNLEVIATGGLSTGGTASSFTCNVSKLKLGKLKNVGKEGFNGLFNPATGINQDVEYSFDNCVIGDNAFKYFNYPSFDGTGIKSIGAQIFSYCGKNIKKVWLPKTIETIATSDTTNGRMFRFDSNPSTPVKIFTDVPDENSIPSGWSVGWNLPSSYVTTIYGSTYQDFLNAEV